MDHKKFKGKYRIESNRAAFWDYSSNGLYFITIVTKNREHFFGDVVDKKMVLSKYGEIVASEIKKIPEYHKRVKLDEGVVMPNHIHLIITLGDYDFDNGISTIGDDNHKNGDGIVEKIHEFSLQYRKQRRKMLIPKILGKLQQQTSKQINILRNTPGIKNWQPNYHDHIIRDQKAYRNIKNYIINNPAKWQADKFNKPENKQKQDND